MKKHLCLVLILLIVISSINIPVFAKGGEEHKKDYEAVLFGTKKLTKAEKNIAEALAAAAYLTIDQYKSYGQKSLDILENYGVGGLPELDEISIEGGGKHRVYAHNGWDSEFHPLKFHDRYNDPKWKEKWKLRKGIIESTVNETFSFNWWSGIPLVGKKIPVSNEECDSFCALIYYVHLLGDHVETHTMDEYNLLMPLGGRTFEDTVVSELQYHSEVLFETQLDTVTYDKLERKLREIDRECLKEGIITSDNICKNQKLAEELLDELKADIPKLLEKEDFFITLFIR